MNDLDQKDGSIADTSEPEGIRHAMSAVPKGAARANAVICSLTGSDRCEADGLTVKHNAPVLAMCRALMGAGYDPVRPLEAYRGEMLCLRISSIGHGAKFTVKDNRCGTPALRRYEASPSVSTAPPMRPNTSPATSPFAAQAHPATT
jgi:hypothetical protein